MATVTISVPEELKHKMKVFPEINWSVVARKAIVERIKILEKINERLSRSKLSKEDTISLGRKLKMSVSKKFMKS